jgi:hypothetical protein
MASYQISDTTGDIVTGSIYLPRSKSVAIGKPISGAAIAVLREELAAVYGDRFEVVEVKAEPAIAAGPGPEAKPPARKKPAGGEVKDGEG